MIGIFFNGPKRVGKDTAARQACSSLQGQLLRHGEGGHVLADKFSRILKEKTHAAYGIQAPHDAFEMVKDKPHPMFLGLTPREAYIAFSETYFRPLHGSDIFGRLMKQHLEGYGDILNAVVFSDCGFIDEIACTFPLFGAHALVVRLHAEGADFTGDSRSYIPESVCDDYGVASIDLVNPITPGPEGVGMFCQKIDSLMRRVVNVCHGMWPPENGMHLKLALAPFRDVPGASPVQRPESLTLA